MHAHSKIGDVIERLKDVRFLIDSSPPSLLAFFSLSSNLLLVFVSSFQVWSWGYFWFLLYCALSGGSRVYYIMVCNGCLPHHYARDCSLLN